MSNVYLDILGLYPGVDEKDINQSFKENLSKFRPDHNMNEEDIEKFKQLQEAFIFLTRTGPRQEKGKVTYDYDPMDPAFENERSSAKVLAQKKVDEFNGDQSVITWNINRWITLLTVPVLFFAAFVLFDMFSKEETYMVQSVSYEPINIYGEMATNDEEVFGVRWHFDGYNYIQDKRNYGVLIDNTNDVTLSVSPFLRKMKSIQFYTDNGIVEVVNDEGLYAMVIYKVLLIITGLLVVIFFITSYHSPHKLTLSITISLLFLIDVVMVFIS